MSGGGSLGLKLVLLAFAKTPLHLLKSHPILANAEEYVVFLKGRGFEGLEVRLRTFIQNSPPFIIRFLHRILHVLTGG